MNRSTPTAEEGDWRRKLIEAVIPTTAEFGCAGLTVDRIVREAGTSSDVFHLHFADAQAAVEAAHECLFERYLDTLRRACEIQPSWPLKVKVGIGVTLDLAAASPAPARFLVETVVGGWDLTGGMVDSRDRLARLLVAGRTGTPLGAELPGVVEPALVSGIAGVISTQLWAGDARHLPALAPQLVELTLIPYLGHERAAELAIRPREGG